MNRRVSVGGPIALIVLGLILAFAVSDRISGVDLGTLGLILTLGGVVWLVIALIQGRSRSQVTSERTNVQGGGAPAGYVTPATGGEQVVQRETRHDEV